jgi:hypothetical protein
LCKRANVLSKRAGDERTGHPSDRGWSQTADLLAALGQLGLDRDELCRAAGVDRQALDKPDSRIPTAQFVAMLTEAERRRGDPFIGMHAGERCEPRGPVAYLLMSHGHLADGLQSLARVAVTAVARIQIDLDIGRDTASVVIHPCDRTFESSPHAVEYLSMALLRMLRRAYPDLDVREVDFRHVRVSGVEEASRAFGAPVRFAAADNRQMFPVRELASPSRLGNRWVAEQLTKLATALAAEVTPFASLQERVAQAARAPLAAGVRPERAVVARRLVMSERSMQRGMEAERTTFRAVRESVLRELGKLCTGGRAEADGWLSHEEDFDDPGVCRPVAACEVRGTGPTLHPGLTGRTSPAAAATGGGPGRGSPARRG